MPWMNNDGLLIKYGTEEAQVGGGGEYRWDGPLTELEIDIQWNRLAAFGTEKVVDETIRIPNGVLLQSAEFRVITPFTSGGSATLTLGLINPDRSTAYDADGIDATVALTAIDAVNETVTCDGALIGTVLNAAQGSSLVTATVGTANYTAGKGVLRLRYFVPVKTATLV